MFRERNSVTGSLEPKAATEYEYDNAYTKGNVLKEKRWDNAKPGTVALPPVSLPDYYSQVFTYSYDPEIVSINRNLDIAISPVVSIIYHIFISGTSG